MRLRMVQGGAQKDCGSADARARARAASARAETLSIRLRIPWRHYQPRRQREGGCSRADSHGCCTA